MDQAAKRKPATLYRYYGPGDQLLYVGITCNGHDRASGHGRDSWWWPYVHHAEFVHGTLEDVVLAERLAIWTERPLANVMARVSTAERLRMLALVDAGPDPLLSPKSAGAIHGLFEREVRAACRMGFIKTEYPRAHWITKQALRDFIGDDDGVDHYRKTRTLNDPPQHEWDDFTARMHREQPTDPKPSAAFADVWKKPA